MSSELYLLHLHSLVVSDVVWQARRPEFESWSSQNMKFIFAAPRLTVVLTFGCEGTKTHFEVINIMNAVMQLLIYNDGN